MELENDVLEDHQFDTILSADIDFSGTLTFEEAFLIRGKVSGEITAQGKLMVDTDAVVEANIAAPKVIIRGKVTGNITAAEGVELTASGKIKGDVSAPFLFMEAGGLLNGLCTMNRKTDEPAADHEQNQ